VLAQLGLYPAPASRLELSLERHEGDDRLAGELVALRDDRGLGDLLGCATSADSISAVESRWPDTLITSSIRPVIQK
jgi:hypothetical protein